MITSGSFTPSLFPNELRVIAIVLMGLVAVSLISNYFYLWATNNKENLLSDYSFEITMSTGYMIFWLNIVSIIPKGFAFLAHVNNIFILIARIVIILGLYFFYHVIAENRDVVIKQDDKADDKIKQDIKKFKTKKVLMEFIFGFFALSMVIFTIAEALLS